MSNVHVLRVFLGPDGGGGNPLGVFLDGPAIAAARRQAAAHDLEFSETVFVDEIDGGYARIAIFTPATEMAFAGHPTIGSSRLLSKIGRPVTTLRIVPATWSRGRTVS